MWKRDQGVRLPASDRAATGATVAGVPQIGTLPVPGGSEAGAKRRIDGDFVNIGKSVVIKGELKGSEDLTIDGSVEGRVDLSNHALTIGPHGRLKAELFAKIVIVLGEIVGNITASEKVDIRDSGSVVGDIVAPRVAIADGAHLRGSVDMQQKRAVAAGPAQAASFEAGSSLHSLPAQELAGQSVVGV